MRTARARRSVLGLTAAVAAASLSSATTVLAAPRPSPVSARSPSNTRLAAFALRTLSVGHGLFTVQGATRCQDRVAATNDGGAVFGRSVGIVAWSCATTPPVTTLAFDDQGDGFLYGPALYVTHDDGARWARSPEHGEVLSVMTFGATVWMLETAHHWMQRTPYPTREPLELLESTDGGRSWVHLAMPAGAFSYAGEVDPVWLVRVGATMAYVESSAVHGVSPSRRTPLWFTEDAGRTWVSRAVPCASPNDDAALSAAPSGVLFATCGSEPGAGMQLKETWRTVDHGRTWQERSGCRLVRHDLRCAAGSQTGGYLGAIDAVSNRTVYLVGARSSLDVSRDGGITWSGVPPGLGGDAGGTVEVDFFNRASGMVLGDGDHQDERPVLWHTTDGGAHWVTVVPRTGA